MFFLLALYTSFLRTSFFTTLLSLLKSTGVVSNFTISDLSNLPFKLLKLSELVFNLSLSILSISAFKLVKSNLAAHLYVSTPLEFFKSDFVEYLDKSIVH